MKRHASGIGTPSGEATLPPLPEETPTVVLSPSTPSAPLELVPGAILAGRYRIVSRLGKGGMGEVYRADDLRLGQPVALKFLTPRNRSPERERQLIDEVRAGREISHPNVCRLHDIGEVDGHLFLSMEYIDGEDLASLLRRIGRLPHDKALTLAREISGGLAAAHESGILHRDLKPANVMIDGRGRARITDFGLAAFEGRQKEEQVISGTPAYMAPEQFEGVPASVASDLFALGLIFFELWTGRRIFSSLSLPEILEQHRTGSATDALRRSAELDPTVAAVIEVCLSPDPAQRPPSARAVLSALPGRDELEAAISAGETPSPAMVAAASDRGALSRISAWGLLVSMLAAVGGVAILSNVTTLPGQLRLPFSAPVLEARAQKILAESGWDTRLLPRNDIASFFFADSDFTRWRERAGSEAQGSLSHAMRFAYRQSPRQLLARLPATSYRVTWTDPPFDVAGMASLTLGIDGTLRSFAVVPPRMPRVAAEPDWQPLLDAAGLNPAGLKPVEPEGMCPVDNDRKVAWIGRNPIDGTPLRIEAAAHRGRPVWFEARGPWEEASTTLPQSRAVGIADGVTFVLLGAIPVVLTLLARRNLRRGQGDRRGATRLALFVLLILETAALLRAHHVTIVMSEGSIVAHTLGMNLLVAVCVWFAYVALEPLVRRRWPKALISWARLLEGRWGDAMVGRDLLVGLTAGCLLGLMVHLLVLPVRSLPLAIPGTSLTGVSTVIFFLIYNIGEAIVRAAGLLAALLIFRGIFRNTTAAVVLTILALIGSNLNMALGPMVVRLPILVVLSASIVLLMLRFGLLAVCAASWVFLTVTRIPLTFDTSLFYFGRSLLGIVVIAALALFAFQRSLDGKSFLPGPLFEE